MSSRSQHDGQVQRPRLVYSKGVTGDSAPAVAPAVEPQEAGTDRRRLALIVVGAVGLAALLLAVMSSGDDRPASPGKAKRGGAFGYAVEEVRGPGIAR